MKEVRRRINSTVVGKGTDTPGELDRGIRHTHLQRKRQVGGCVGHQRKGWEGGKLGYKKNAGSEGYQNNVELLGLECQEKR